MVGEKVSKLGRLRRKVLGLVALGFRPKQYRAEFEWIFGVPTARQVKRGLSWSIRTPSRLVKLGLKPEHHLGDLEADVCIGEISKSELVELFFRMMEKWILEKQVKAIPGRKTDELDSQWLARVCSAELTKPSYILEKK